MSKKQKYSDNCILVVDVESTCQENKDGQPQETFVSEIIEVGYAVLDYKTNEIKEDGSIIVKPIQSVVTPYCTNLTSLTQEIVDRGISFQEACETLQRDLISGGRLWGSFGNYDVEMFRKECERKNVKYPFTPQHANIKSFCTLMNGEVNGLGRALSKIGLNFEGRHHSGKDDARNAARILQYYKAKLGATVLI